MPEATEKQGRLWIDATICGLIFLAVSSTLLAQSSLKSRRDFSTGDHPVGILAVDFDADGILDLLSVDQLSNSVSLEKGFGDGTFRRLGGVATGTYPSGAVFVDVNGDGRPDLVTSNLLTRDVTVNLADGRGGFGAKISSTSSGNGTGITAGDWNGDGKIDVATINSQQNNMSILLGDGTGHFGTPRLLTVGIYPKAIVTADFNKDGKADLAVVNRDSSNIQIWNGDGTGQFALSKTLGTDSTPVFLAVADFNSDGNLDLAVSISVAVGTIPENVSIYLGSSTGNYGTPVRLTPGFGPQGIVAADINKDGKLDLLVTLSEVSPSGAVAEMLGDGAGNFAAATVFNSGNSPRVLAVGDFNRDGSLDVATANNGGNNISILQNLGTGTFLVAGKVVLPSGSFPDAIVAAEHPDLNLDNKPDLAVATELTNTVLVALGDCTGNFSTLTSANNVGITPIAMAIADFNADGDPDLVTANNYDNTYSVLQNSGTANFTVTNGLSIGLACDSAVAVSSGEISGDNHPDLAFVCEGVGYLCTLKGTGAGGASAFGAPVCTQLGGTSEGVALGNYNLDALNDAAVAARDLNVAQIAISDGSGGVVDIPATFPVGTQPIGIARGDLNGDGFTDLVVTNSSSANVSSMLGDGGGAFTFPSILTPAAQGPVAVVLKDFNMDGLLDAVVVNSNSSDVSLLLGDGAGHFTNAGNYGVRDQPLAIAAGDFNCDGKPDVAVADNNSDTVSILLNQSVSGDPLLTTTLIGTSLTVYEWGVVPGGVYDVVRGQVKSVTQGTSSFNLGPVTCLANDLAVTDTGDSPDTTVPPVGDAYFYAVRAIVNGIPGQYTVSTNGKPGIPSSGGCP